MSKFTGNIIRLPAITPSQSSASGVFTLDDQFTAQATGTWPILRDQYFNYTTLLLTGAVQGTTGPNPVTQPYSFLSDASTNNFVVSPNGDVSARAFNPYLNNYSAYFDGVNDYCSLSGSADFSIPTSTTPFTVEGWIYPTSTSAISVVWTERYNGPGNTVSLACGLMDGSSFWLAGRYPGFAYYNGSGWTGAASTVQVELNTWSHVAYVFTGSACKVFLNGVDVTKPGGPTTWAITGVSGEAWYIGSVWDGNIYFSGYISNLRYVVGTAVYTTNFTPSTQPLTAITNTKLLTCQSNRFVDNSASPKTITPNNGVAVSQNSPFVSYDTTNGSGYFDGTLDWLSAPDSSAYTMGTGDFTVEAWVYCTAADFASSRYIIAQRNSSADTSISFAINLIGSNQRKVRLLCFDTGGASYEAVCASDVINLNAWTHIAGVRDGATLRIYVNGVQQGTANISTASLVDSNGGVAVGRLGDADFYYWLGYISNVRVTKGGCLYPSGTQFTPPTAPLTTTVSAGTVSLLTLQTRAPATNNGFVDSSPNNFVITRNGNTTQGTFTPFSPTGWGNYFDGVSGTYLSVPRNSVLLPGASVDFTFEAWVYLTATPGGESAQIMGFGEYGTDSDWTFTVNSSLQFGIWFGAVTSFYANTTQTLTLNTWHHVAASRSGTAANNLKVFVNGVGQSFSQNATTVSTGNRNLSIGADQDGTESRLTGYISNIRIINGQGLYTGNFTPPTAAFTATSVGTTGTNVATSITGTVGLITCQSNRFIDTSPNNFTVTRNGGVSVQAFSPFAPASSYIPSLYGGSGYFPGSTSVWLVAPDNPALELGSNDFTIECWVYSTADFSANRIFSSKWNHFVFGINNTPALSFTWYGTTNGSATGTLISTAPNAWHHFAVCRQGSTLYMFQNGQKLTQSNSTITGTLNNDSYGPMLGGNENVVSGAIASANEPWYGYISGYRMVNGTALYTSSFPIPTAPPTPVTGTSLLLNFTNGGIVDATGKNNLETVGNSGVQTSQAKWSPGSMYFNGSTDYLKQPSTVVFSGDFVIEGWVYFSSSATGFPSLLSGTTSGQLQLQFNSTGATYYVNFGGSTIINAQASGLSTDTWTHFAIVRSGTATNNISAYFGGTRRNQATSTATVTQALLIGVDGSIANPFKGYIDDFRITLGNTRGYTGTTITVPTGPFPIG